VLLSIKSRLGTFCTKPFGANVCASVRNEFHQVETLLFCLWLTVAIFTLTLKGILLWVIFWKCLVLNANYQEVRVAVPVYKMGVQTFCGKRPHRLLCAGSRVARA